jgi:hypothetical protein
MSDREVCDANDAAVRVEDGALVIDVLPLAAPVRIRPWRDGFEVERREASGWRAAACTSDVSLALAHEGDGEGAGRIAQFLAAIPQRAKRAARYAGEHSLAALRLLARHPRGRRWADRPALLALVAREADTRGFASALRLLDEPPSRALAIVTAGRAVAGALGLLDRVDLAADGGAALPWLLDAIASPHAIRLLQHAGRIDAWQLRAAVGFAPYYVGPFARRAFAQVRFEPVLNGTLELYRRTVAVGRRAGILRPSRQLAGIRPYGIRAVFNHWRYLSYVRGRAPDAETPLFPAPPLAGTASIVPLAHGATLLEESAQMRHCIVEYEHELLDGALAAYRVLAPGRATLLLDARSLAIVELRGPGNEEPSEETVHAVEQWLAEGARSWATSERE